MACAFAVFVCISMCVVKAAHVVFPCLAVAGGWLDEALHCFFSGRLDEVTKVTDVLGFLF